MRDVTAVQRALGDRITAQRAERGLSLSELARRSGLSKATLSSLESGAGNPTVVTLVALADALEVGPDLFLRDSASP